MNSITITLPDEALTQLKVKAARLGISPEELARVRVEEPLAQPDEAFQQAVAYVLQKNGELYRRLT
jgi:hypothetical protein